MSIEASDVQHASNYREALRAFQRKYFGDLLTWCRGNVADVARTAGVERTNLYRMLRILGLKPRDYRSRIVQP